MLKQISAGILLLASQASGQTVNWFAICDESNQIDMLCPDLDRAATFSCLVKLFKEESLEQTCSDAIELRGAQERINENMAWEAPCEGDAAVLCAEAGSDAALQYLCLTENKESVDSDCRRSLVPARARTAAGAAGAAGAAQPPPRPPQPPPQPVIRCPTLPPPQPYRLRLFSEPNKCLRYTMWNESEAIDDCDKYHWMVFPTVYGYTLSTGQNLCMARDAVLVPCSSAGTAFFKIDRNTDHSVSIQEISSQNCLGYDDDDGATLDESCLSTSGWYLEQKMVEFKIYTQEPTAEPTSPVPTAEPAEDEVEEVEEEVEEEEDAGPAVFFVKPANNANTPNRPNGTRANRPNGGMGGGAGRRPNGGAGPNGGGGGPNGGGNRPNGAGANRPQRAPAGPAAAEDADDEGQDRR